MFNDLGTFALTASTAVLLVAAWWLRSRLHIGEDFALARRRLHATMVGLSQAINCVPAWMLMMLSLLAYTIGLAALWMALAMLIGLAINWWWVAPQLRKHAVATNSFTLSHWFASTAGDSLHAVTRRSATSIVVFCIGLATITQLQWAASRLAGVLGTTALVATLLIVGILLTAAVLAGIWAACIGDLIQLSVLTVGLPLVAIYSFSAIGGWEPLWSGVMTRERALAPWFNGYSGVLAVALLVGVFFAGLASAAQPQVIARYFACRDELTLRRARLIALSWSVFALAIALLIGWCARVLLHGQLSAGELLDALTSKTVPSAAAAFVSVAVAIAFALSCVSPWVATAVHLAMDLRGPQHTLSLLWCQVCVCLLGVLLGLAAIYLPAGNEDRLWLCWHSLSAAFGPLLLVRLTGKKVRPASALGAMWSGFVLTALFHLMPDTPGDLLERSLPFIAAMGIALSGGDQRRNPNRADRGDKTIHDHLPI